MEEIEAEKLACAAFGIDYYKINTPGHINEMLHTGLGVTLQQFQVIAELLMPLTLPGESMITRQLFHGFVKDDVFIVRSPCERTDD